MESSNDESRARAMKFTERAFDVDRECARNPWRIRFRWLCAGLSLGVLGAVVVEHYQSVKLERDALRMVLDMRGAGPDYNAIVSVITGVKGNHDPRSPVYQWVVDEYQENLKRNAVLPQKAIPGHL